MLTTALPQLIFRQLSTWFSASGPLRELNTLQYSIATAILLGAIIGLCQWTVLRKYIPSWKWILATWVPIVFTSSITGTFNMWRETLDPTGSLPGTIIARAIIIMAVLNLGLVSVSGLLEQYVLRPYITRTRWWLFVPFISLIPGTIAAILAYIPALLQISLPIPISPFGIGLWTKPLTQGLAFCLLNKKHLNETELDTEWNSRPSIKNYWQSQNRKKTLQTQISRLWQTDLSLETGALRYLLITDRASENIRYCPLDSISSEQATQTPLPEIARIINPNDLASADLKNSDRFNLTFKPPGFFQIQNLRSIPLLWLALSYYLAIIVIAGCFLPLLESLSLRLPT